MCLFAPADVRKHITAGANKLWFKHSFSFNERKVSCFTSPPAEKPSSLPSAANVLRFDQVSDFKYTHTHARAR